VKDVDIKQHPAVRRFAEVPKQKLFKGDDQHGNCWSCCVGAILGIPIEEVPHFMELSLKSENPSMHTLTQRWLNERGFWLVQTKSKPYAMQNWGDNILCPPMIVSGPTVRSKRPEEQHAVVMLNGMLLYDPHPSEAGLLAETDYALIMAFYPNLYPNLA
jgi:hypothetical protein